MDGFKIDTKRLEDAIQHYRTALQHRSYDEDKMEILKLLDAIFDRKALLQMSIFH